MEITNKLSIVIPVYNKVEFTRACIDSIKKSKEYGLVSEIIIVDNGSTDGTSEYLSSEPNITPVLNKKNLGFASACNSGAAIANSEYILFLNNDTMVSGTSFEPLLKDIVDPDIGVVGSKLMYPDGTIQHAGVVFDKNILPKHIYKRVSPERHFVNKRREFKAVTGACLLTKKSLFNKLGGFDTVYINGLEDVDYCLRVIKSGKKVIYEPRSVLTHYESISEGRTLKRNSEKNTEIFLKRWKNALTSDEDEYLAADGNLSEIELLKKAIEKKDKWIKHLEVDVSILKKENEVLRKEAEEYRNHLIFKIMRKINGK